MRIKKDFVLRQVADNWIVLALGETSVNFNKMLTLNESGVLLWQALENGCDKNELVNILLDKYNVDIDAAIEDVDYFVEKLIKNGCVE